jgi:recombination protein RecA
VKVAKNKIAPPFKVAEIEIMFDKGISKEGEIIDLGTTMGFIQKSGTWYSCGEERIGQGREGAKKYLIDNPAIRDEVEKKIREKTTIQTNPDEKPATKTGTAKKTETT